MPFANKIFRERYGEPLEKCCYNFLFNKNEPCKDCETYKVLKTNKPHNWEWTGPDNRVYDVYDFPFIEEGDHKFILEMGIDITERKHAERELQKNKEHLEDLVKERTLKLHNSEEKYRGIVENTTNVIMVTQPDANISYLSPSCKEVFGYNPKELIGTNPNIFHPEDKQKVQQALSIALKGEKGSSFEYRILTKQGKIKWVSHSWSPIFTNKQLQSIVSVIEDISQRKETEYSIKELNENLMHQAIELAAANKELEAFSYSVSHDLRAPLRSIDGFSQALMEDYTDVLDKQGKEYLQRVQKASQHMGELIDDMLKLSRLSRTEMTINKVDLSEASAIIMERFKKEDPSRKIDFVKQDNLIAEGDPNLLNILLENLLGNAWKFTKKCKLARIEFGKKQQNKETVFFIKDNGAGFDMKYANKLFIPFQRLHDEADYPGTGIGLGIVSRIIHRHGGQIWAEGEENKGATFYFTLGGKVK
jgi:PAS domain S-box-containing protein